MTLETKKILGAIHVSDSMLDLFEELMKSEEPHRSKSFMTGMANVVVEMAEQIFDQRNQAAKMLEETNPSGKVRMTQEDYPAHERALHTIPVIESILNSIMESEYINQGDKEEDNGAAFAIKVITKNLEVGLEGSKKVANRNKKH